MRVFVTGGTGVLGRPTVRMLVERGHDVTVLVRSAASEELACELGAEPARGDLFDPAFIRQAVAGMDVVMHLATAIPKKARPSARDWVMNDRIRREGTRILLDAVQGQPLHSFVVQSVAFLYGDRRGAWITEQEKPKPARNLVSCVELEQMALEAYDQYNVPSVVLRGAMFYGPEAHSTRLTIDSLKRRTFPIIGSGEQYWHYIYVDDMARACVIAAEYPAPGEVFFVADDWPFHAKDLLNWLAAQLNAPAPFKLARLARLLGGSATTLLAQSARYRTDKIKKMLGWTPAYPTYRDGYAEILRTVGVRL